MSREVKAKLPYQRRVRLGEEIRHALVKIFQRIQFRDPVLQDRSITVTEVQVSADLRCAKVYVMPLGGEALDESVAALQRAAPHLRATLTRAVYLRFVPTLRFKADQSFQQAGRIGEILRQPIVQRDLLARDSSDQTADQTAFQASQPR